MATDFIASWDLCRGRFDDSIRGLTHEQLNWRLQPNTLTAAESAIHVAGVELWFYGQLMDDLRPEWQRIYDSARAGVIDDRPFPFTPEEMTPEFVMGILDQAREIVRPLIENPSAETLAKEMESALGPIVKGHGALARLAFHPGYHHGQIHFLMTAPGFPK